MNITDFSDLQFEKAQLPIIRVRTIFVSIKTVGNDEAITSEIA